MTLLEFLLVTSAAFCAGVLNTLAGGGTFLTFPALVAIGVPPVAANATSALAVFPGYLTGALGFRRELRDISVRSLARMSAITLAGGLVGALLLMVSPDRTFAAIVPFLLLVATLGFQFSARIAGFARRHALKPEGAAGLFVVCVYGGYFNGGLGILLLALFALWGMRDINRMNGLKTGLSFVLAAISVLAFVLAGLIVWLPAMVMMAAAMVGGYAGAPIARRLPDRTLRLIVVSTGYGMTALFLWRLF